MSDNVELPLSSKLVFSCLLAEVIVVFVHLLPMVHFLFFGVCYEWSWLIVSVIVGLVVAVPLELVERDNWFT